MSHLSQPVRGILAAAAAVAVFGLASTSDAALLSVSASAPSGSTVSQPDFSAPAFDGAKDFTDNAGPPGQTFGSPSITQAFSLQSVTVKGFANTSASFGGISGGNFVLTLSSVGAGNTLTVLRQETVSAAAATDGSAYLTFTLDTPLVLPANATYEWSLHTSAGYFGLAKSTTDVYAAGVAMQHGTTGRTAATGATVTNPQTVDRTFFLNGTLVPEPASAGLLGGAAAVGLLLRRRRG